MAHGVYTQKLSHCGRWRQNSNSTKAKKQGLSSCVIMHDRESQKLPAQCQQFKVRGYWKITLAQYWNIMQLSATAKA